MKRLNRRKLIFHLEGCIKWAERRADNQVAEVMKNLKKEIEAGEFDINENEEEDV